jgi:hypothetical protein
VQIGQVNGLLADAGEFRLNIISSRGLSIAAIQEDNELSTIDTGPAYYDKEPADAYSAEEREDQIESGSPGVFIKV